MTNQDKPHQILLGFDFGTKRIGVAIGQTITKTARPLATILNKNGEPAWEKMDELFKKNKPDAAVVGMPLNMDGTEQSITQGARDFAEALQKRYLIPIHAMDERLTTKAAREYLFAEGGFKALKTEKIDQVAAKLILENWMATHENNN